MSQNFSKCLLGAAAAIISQASVAGTDTFFNPLTQSAAVSTPNSGIELNTPWQTPAGISQQNLMSLNEVEADVSQSVIRVPAGNVSSMFDMIAYDDSGKYLFIPHETPFGAGASRYDIENDKTEVIFAGDGQGVNGDWTNDYGAFDPSTYTPNGSLLLGEEWTGEGRIIEILNPLAPVEDIEYRELESIANVSHEGLRFSADGETLYYVDEWNSGSIYKIVFDKVKGYGRKKKVDYTSGQTFVLSVDAFDGNPADLWNEQPEGTSRTGMATWIPLTDADGNVLTEVDPFMNGPTNDPRSNEDTRGGRPAADEVAATPYGRPEDMEVGKLDNGNEVVYFAATSERTIYSIEILGGDKAMVRVFASDAETPKNEGFPATTAQMNSPDNLAQDALGNIYIIEDAPNGSSTGGDIWFARDTDGDGVAESIDHFLSIQVDGSEATGMIFNPKKPTQFVVAVQHPDSTNLDNVPEGFGDAVWIFDLEDVVPPTCKKGHYRYSKYYGRHEMFARTCSSARDFNFVRLLKRAAKKQHYYNKRWYW